MIEKVSDTQKRLIELMYIFGKTQKDVADETKLNKATISLYCNGQRLARQDKIAIIADTYGIDPAWLIGYDVPMIRTNKSEGLENVKEYIRNAPEADLKYIMAYAEAILSLKEESRKNGK